MNFILRIRKYLLKKYTEILSADKLIKLTKKYIKKSDYMPIAIMYHCVKNNADDNLSVSEKTMEENILFFKKHGFDFLFEEEFYQSHCPSVILTFDDGYKDNYTNLFPLLTKHNAKASVNIIASKLISAPEADYLTIEEIKTMLDSGLVSIQSHAFSHRHLSECSEAELETELKKSKEVLEEQLGINCNVLVTPYLQNSQLITSVAKRHYDFIYSSPINNVENKYCISRIGSSDKMSEKQLARELYLKAKENYKIRKSRV